MVEGFLLGVVAMSSVTAGAFFLKFWRRTHDSLFLSFGIAFFLEGLNRCAVLFSAKPSEASPIIYVVRLCLFLLILAAIVKKNYGTA
jgi:hypothetical protein